MTDRYEIQISSAESGPYRLYTTIKSGNSEQEQQKAHSIALPKDLVSQPSIVRVVAVSKKGKVGQVKAIMNSFSPEIKAITEVVVNEKDKLWSLNFNPAKPQVVYATYVQDASHNIIATLRVADYAQGKLSNVQVINPSGYGGLFSKDGKLLAYFQPRTTDDLPRLLVIREMETGLNRTLRLPANLWIGSMAWSPDGQHIAFLEQNNEYTRLWKLTISTEKLEPITAVMPYKEPGGLWQGSIDWTPDGKAIIATRSDHQTSINRRFGLSMISVANGRILSDFMTLPNWRDESPSFSPDGKQIAFLSSRTGPSSNNYSLWLRDIATNQLRHLRFPEGFQLSSIFQPHWINGSQLLIAVYSGYTAQNRYYVVSI
ncbi:hypothetical protein AWR27_24570 [Spirosoma montaniterrae]|uniref:Uncharacterized protein n=1 Tax=Spirosoma montaniterrae TaxID=1178516 RepID=A0A1P9X3K3_9BACT|nr:hypothetical protein AWR27_24570 [Spirosoma montaniterrae]